MYASILSMPHEVFIDMPKNQLITVILTKENVMLDDPHVQLDKDRDVQRIDNEFMRCLTTNKVNIELEIALDSTVSDKDRMCKRYIMSS